MSIERKQNVTKKEHNGRPIVEIKPVQRQTITGSRERNVKTYKKEKRNQTRWEMGGEVSFYRSRNHFTEESIPGSGRLKRAHTDDRDTVARGLPKLLP